MPEPIEFQAIQALQTALLSIAVASGYHYTVAAGMVKLNPDHAAEARTAPSGPRPFVLIEVAPESWRYDPAEQIVLHMPVTVYWIGTSDPATDNSWMQAYFRGCADIEKAIASSRASIGALATEVEIRKRTPDQSFGAEVWAVLDLDVRIDRTFGQPNA